MERIRRAMYGRYGGDQLMIGSLVVYMLLAAIARMTQFFPLMILAYAVFVWSMFRIFSRDISRRYQENQLFLKYWNRVPAWFRTKKKSLQDHKIYRYYKCPNCTTRLRVPKGRGKIEITCPICKVPFIRKS
ncbi:hypothetical protein [Clostridium minihomine]|uniref:hypothetical protein n=1 Tax=Clostridium minihomine TaxID=2045012 RepID=UPI001FB31F69|nr:hypothetical protein [Clostridium minihomine]